MADLKRFGYSISGKEIVEDIHPLGHMAYIRPGDEMCFEGTGMAESAEMMRETILHMFPLYKPWPCIWEIGKAKGYQHNW